ncbi:MAG: PBP1A family penicillin-binding protein [Bacilli bacterium]|nr:PBP1A family penicillin-binding protein [Bacilli bacterium]
MKKKTKKILKITLLPLLIIVLGNIIFYVYCFLTPKLEINKSQSYYLYDNNSKLVFGDNDWIPLNKISDDLINATISTEDKYFYKHIGFDYLRIGKAAITNIINRNKSEGASTITQQYARNLFLNFDKTWKRKIDEAILAGELEVHYTKKEILEGYLNTINYGGVYGIESASKYYFDKSASNLSLAEAALLAGIPKSPNNYSPIKNYSKAKERQKIVLTMMKKNKVISEEEYQKALNENITIVGKSKESNIVSVNYFKDSVLEELKSLKQIPSNIIETGGLKIYTTLDSEAQEDLENSVQKYINNEQELETSAIMMNPDTGGIMALIGGNNYNKSQYNRATNSKRQIGSTMKPILYYTALESGFTPSSSFTSEKTTFTFSEGKTYSPKNYNDKYAEGPISMAAAISYSDNIYAVKTHLFLGEDMLINTAKRIGITSKLTPIPSLALGTEEMSLMEITAAYSSFANQGYKINPHFIKKVEDSKGNTLYENKEEKIEVLNSSLTYILNEMLTYTYNKNFIDYNYPTLISLLPNITHKYAIKSGTTDTDLLIMGYNKNAVLSVWTGYDDNKKIDSTKYSYHKNIWIDTMESYFKNHEAQWYDIPDNVVGVLVNPITGTLIDDNAEKKEMFFYIKGTEPTTNNETKDLEAVFKEEQKSKLEE